MINTILDQENFDYQKTLSEIGEQIAKARATLKDLEDGQQDFLAHQEQLTLQKVKNIVEASEEALKIATSNQELLKTWQDELIHYAQILLVTNDTLGKQTAAFNEEARASYAEIDANLYKIRSAYADIKMRNSIIETQTKTISRQQEALKDESKKIASQQASLALAFKELSQRKGKI